MSQLNWNCERWRTRDRLLNYITFSLIPTELTAYIDKAIIDYSTIEDKKSILTLLYYPYPIVGRR